MGLRKAGGCHGATGWGAGRGGNRAWSWVKIGWVKE